MREKSTIMWIGKFMNFGHEKFDINNIWGKKKNKV